MFAHGCVGRIAFEYLFDLVDPAPGTIQLITEELVSRTGGGAKSAMYAGPQDLVGLAALGCVTDEVGERCLHGDSAC